MQAARAVVVDDEHVALRVAHDDVAEVEVVLVDLRTKTLNMYISFLAMC